MWVLSIILYAPHPLAFATIRPPFFLFLIYAHPVQNQSHSHRTQQIVPYIYKQTFSSKRTFRFQIIRLWSLSLSLSFVSSGLERSFESVSNGCRDSEHCWCGEAQQAQICCRWTQPNQVLFSFKCCLYWRLGVWCFNNSFTVRHSDSHFSLYRIELWWISWILIVIRIVSLHWSIRS